MEPSSVKSLTYESSQEDEKHSIGMIFDCRLKSTNRQRKTEIKWMEAAATAPNIIMKPYQTSAAVLRLTWSILIQIYFYDCVVDFSQC